VKSLQYLLVLFFSVVLASCGGGGATTNPPATYSISGTVSGNATSGVLITLSGTSSATTTTAAGGTYTFSGLSNGSYTVTPSLTGNIFTPSSSAVTVNGANVTGTNFTATANVAPTYTISGTVSGAATSGVTITLSGANSGSVITGAGGTYSFPGLVAGSYTVTPSLASYTFSPTSTPVTIVAANSTGNNFTATAVTYSISGTVSGNATSGVTMTLSGAGSATTTTGGGGTYTFTGLLNGSYTVTPSLTGNVFTPSSTAVIVSGANVAGTNFVAASNVVPTYTISGTVSGAVTSGVTVALSGASTGSVVTGVGGTYSFSSLVSGSYTVTPTLTGYTFSPTNIAIASLAANSTGNNFTATAIPPATYSISGTVSGNATSGVTMTLSGAASATTTTGGGGTYTFTGLSNGSYTVTPSLAGNVFTPASLAVGISGANSTGRNFTAASNVAPTYTISGAVSGAATSGVTINLSGAGTGSVVTGVGGTYSFSSLVAGSYTVTPSLTGYTFSPTNIAIASLAANSTGNNFTATAIPVSHSISGTVSGAVSSGVTIAVTGTATAGTTTDGSGNYTVNGLFDGNYTVTPSLAGYTFTPNSTSVPMSGANVTGKNFTSAVYVAPTYTLSGTVTGVYVQGVTVTLSGAGSATTTTNASGNYSFANLPAGTYTVTPSLAGYTYSPAAPSVAISANTTQNFTATSTVASSTISGTLTYSGTKTGGMTVRVFYPSCTTFGSCQVIGATHFAPQAGAFSLSYQIRGIPTGTYVVKAGFNPVNTGGPNIANPGGTSASVSTTAGTDNTGVNITITDPASIAAPSTPTGVTIWPSDQAVMVFYSAPTNAGGAEKADSYKVYWSTNPDATTGGSSQTFTAQGTNQNVYFLNGLTNGVLYFKMSAINHSTTGTLQESAATAVIPVTIGATTGSNTVSGTVTYTGTASGPMLVGMYDTATNNVYFTTIASPSSPQSFSISGVPTAAAYFNFAVVDNNNNGIIDAGDFQNTQGNGTPVAVSGNTTSNVTLTPAYSSVHANTDHQYDGSNNYYSIILGAQDEIKKVVDLVLLSGPNVAVPRDMDATSGQDSWIFLNTTSPTVGDTYTYKVFYSDATNEIKTATVSSVLSTSNMAQSLAYVMDGTGGSSAGIPYFTWAAPASPLGSYTYRLHIFGNSGSFSWNYPQNNDLPSTTLSALYDSSAMATGSYTWQVTVRDANGDRGTRNYTVIIP